MGCFWSFLLQAMLQWIKSNSCAFSNVTASFHTAGNFVILYICMFDKDCEIVIHRSHATWLSHSEHLNASFLTASSWAGADRTAFRVVSPLSTGWPFSGFFLMNKAVDPSLQSTALMQLLFPAEISKASEWRVGFQARGFLCRAQQGNGTWRPQRSFLWLLAAQISMF